mmetsp:Transcript_10252/g.22242  ORF Transcript_10252/g.22242 Transcript_10252/m.22242 type:complete len:393 (+) Transcript_10252:170-1348(+)
MRIIPQAFNFGPSAKYSQTLKRLRIKNGSRRGVSVGTDNTTVPSLSSPEAEGLNDTYESHVPVTTPADASGASGYISSETSKQVPNDILSSSLGSDSSEASAAIFPANERNIRSHTSLTMGPGNGSEITNALTMRIEIGSESGLSTTLNLLELPSDTPINGSNYADSAYCNSEAATAFQSNLSSQSIQAKPSALDLVDLSEVASIPFGKEESCVSVDDMGGTNSFRQTSKKHNPDPEAAAAKINTKVAIAPYNEEAEQLYRNEAISSKPESPLPSLESSGSSSVSSGSNSSREILLPPKRALGNCNPFCEETDLSLPGALRGKHRVRFLSSTNTGKERSRVYSERGSNSVVEAQVSDTPSACTSSACSDDSTSSFEHLINWCGVSCEALEFS